MTVDEKHKSNDANDDKPSTEGELIVCIYYEFLLRLSGGFFISKFIISLPMPLIIPSSNKLPIYNSLVSERVHVIDKSRAEHQDIRPLRIGLLNLMPAAVREKTEIQFFRLLGNTPLQIEPVLIRFDDFIPNTGKERMEVFYEKFVEVKSKGLDGLIVTGANLETQENGLLLDFDQIHFVDEWKKILDWAKEYVTSTIYSCLGSHFALEHFYKIEREHSEQKIFGVFTHTLDHSNHPEILRGMNDQVPVPHSRWGNIPIKSINHPELQIVAQNPDCGWHMILGRNGREIYLQGHPEYDREDLVGEYLRDKENGQEMPHNYFPNNDETQTPICNWKADSSVFYRNWVNHVYQTTGYDTTKPFMES